MKNILVIGGGSWGTCLSKLLVENKNNVFLWEYNEKTRNVIREKRENPVFLPNIKLPKELNVVDSYCETLKNEKIDVILLATPTQFLRPILKNLKECLSYKVIIVNVAKGIEIKSKKLSMKSLVEKIIAMYC